MRTQAITAKPMQAVRRVWWLSGKALIVWWLLGGIALGFGVGIPCVQRTQEGRVLETARQMLGRGWHAWVVPTLNDQVRVRKPPLAYWLTAISYRIAGVSETSGRMPAVLAGWLTLAVTFFCGQWLFGRRAGFFAAACLLTSYLFFRHSRLGETDVLAMFFVTLATYALWRGVEPRAGTSDGGQINSSRPYLFSAREVGWLHLGAAAVALAILAKGPPGAYPLLFLVGLSLIRFSAAPLVRFLRSGAVITLLVLALPWFTYIFHTVGYRQWKMETDELLGGQDHWAAFYFYFWEVIKAAGPWSLVMIGALVAGAWHWRDRRVAGMLLWFAVIFIPLLFLPNRQFHYLMPLMPPAMILVGWWLDWVLAQPRLREGRMVPLLDLTIFLSILAVPGILVGAVMMEGQIKRADAWLASSVAVAALAVILVYVMRGRFVGLLAYLIEAAIVFVPLVGIWMPWHEGLDSRDFAAEFRQRFGNGPYCFYGRNCSLPLCFNLREKVPQVRTAVELVQLAQDTHDLHVIVQTKSRFAPPPLPAGFAQQGSDVDMPGQRFRVYKFQP